MSLRVRVRTRARIRVRASLTVNLAPLRSHCRCLIEPQGEGYGQIYCEGHSEGFALWKQSARGHPLGGHDGDAGTHALPDLVAAVDGVQRNEESIGPISVRIKDLDGCGAADNLFPTLLGVPVGGKQGSGVLQGGRWTCQGTGTECRSLASPPSSAT